jgi:hypothetical protein
MLLLLLRPPTSGIPSVDFTWEIIIVVGVMGILLTALLVDHWNRRQLRQRTRAWHRDVYRIHRSRRKSGLDVIELRASEDDAERTKVG